MTALHRIQQNSVFVLSVAVQVSKCRDVSLIPRLLPSILLHAVQKTEREPGWFDHVCMTYFAWFYSWFGYFNYTTNNMSPKSDCYMNRSSYSTQLFQATNFCTSKQLGQPPWDQACVPQCPCEILTVDAGLAMPGLCCTQEVSWDIFMWK